MLFNYRYVPHDIDKLQEWLRHLVQQVWCRHGGAYSIDLLHEELQAVILEVFNTDEDKPRGKSGDYLYGPIKRIDAIFQKSLTVNQRNEFRDWFDYNNDIRALCAGNPVVKPITYDDVRKIDTDLAIELKQFCDSLFESVIKWKAVTKRAAEIDAHYDAFVRVNNEGKCPFCGYGDIKSEHYNKREAYDHYLPKSTYPFNSVNFKNLAPMCHECNSSYKLEKDPIRNIARTQKSETGSRRKAFYSYGDKPSGISIALDLKTTDIDNLTPSDIDLRLTAPYRNEELNAWMDVFGIEERFKAKCCGKNDGKYWLSQAVEECANVGKTAEEIVASIIQNAVSSPWAEVNFLKKPFLIACKDAGLI